MASRSIRGIFGWGSRPGTGQAPGDRLRPLERYGRLLGGNLLVLGLLLTVTEGLASYLLLGRALLAPPGPAARIYTHYDADLGWVNVPNIDLAAVGSDGAVHTNAQGLRHHTNVTSAVPDGKVRILCSGDSFTFGYGVDNEHTWCQLLAGLDVRLETVNMGVDGYGVDQAYLRYKRDGVRLEHHVHLLAFITDDFRRMQLATFYTAKPVLKVEGGALVVTNVPVPKPTALFPWITDHAAALRRLRTVEFLERAGRKLGWRPTETSRPLEQGRDEQTKDVLRKIFVELTHLSTQRSSTFALVYLPSLDELPDATPQAWLAFVAEEARGLGIPFINVVSQFQALPNDEAICLYRRNGHFSTRGNALTARIIYEQLMGDPVVARALAQRGPSLF